MTFFLVSFNIIVTSTSAIISSIYDAKFKRIDFIVIVHIVDTNNDDDHDDGHYSYNSYSSSNNNNEQIRI